MSEENMDQQNQKPAMRDQSVNSENSINEESGIGWQGYAHGAAALTGLGLAWKLAASGQPEAAIAAGVVGLALTFNTLGSTWFTQKQNHATITTFFGKKMGNITGGGIKTKKPWPWRKKYDTVPTFVKSLPEDINGIKTADNVFVDSIKYNVFFKIVDPATYVFSADNREEQMMIKVANNLRGKVANSIALLHTQEDKKALEDQGVVAKPEEEKFDLYADRKVIEEAVMSEVNQFLRDEYGIEVVSIPIEEPILEERFVNAAAERMKTIQDGLARESYLESEGRGYRKQRQEMFTGYAELAKGLYNEGAFSSIEAAIRHIEFLVGRETVRDAAREGAMILSDGQMSSTDQTAKLMAIGKMIMENGGFDPKTALQDNGGAAATVATPENDDKKQGPAASGMQPG